MRRRDHILTARQLVPVPRDRVFAFFAEAENLELVTPPALHFTITSSLPVRMAEGTIITYRLKLFGVPFRWKTCITRWEPSRSFVDEQIEGPYDRWIHTHTFRDARTGTLVVDSVRYRLPLYPVGELVHPLVRRQLARIFTYRAERIRTLLAIRSGVPGAEGQSSPESP